MRRFPARILISLMFVVITSPIAVFADGLPWYFQLSNADGRLTQGQPYTVDLFFIPEGDASDNNGNDGLNNLRILLLDVVFDDSKLQFVGVDFFDHYVDVVGGTKIWQGGIPAGIPDLRDGNQIHTISGFGGSSQYFPDDEIDPSGQIPYNLIARISFSHSDPGSYYTDLIKSFEPSEREDGTILAQIDGENYLWFHDSDFKQWRDAQGNRNFALLPIPPYVLHLGFDEETGEDFFPQETVEESYYSGVASALQALKFLSGPLPDPDNPEPDDPRNWPSQAALFEMIGGTAGQDLTALQLATLLNMLTYNHPDPDWPWKVYHFGAQADFSTGDPQQGDPKQDLAIKRLIHWIDYDVPIDSELLPGDGYDDQVNVPAQVPFGGTYSWLTVRGFSSDFPPTVDGSVHALPPEIVFNGAWLNDPRVGPGDIGHNEFLTAEEFKENYLQVEGAYRSVAEPPPSPAEEQLESSLDSIQLTYASGRSSAAVSAALDRQEEMDVVFRDQGDGVLVSGIKSLEYAQMVQSQFEEIQWEELIPVELRTASDFAASYADTQFNQALTVYNLDTDEQYNLLLFGKSDTLDSASVVLQVDESDARFQRASWVDEEYQYLSSRGARRIAYEAMQDSYPVNRVELTRWYKRGVVSDAQGVEQPVEYTARLVWSAELSPSEFLPVHEVSTPFGPTVLVKQDGTYALQGDLDPEFIQQEAPISSAVEEAPADTSLISLQETALATLPLSSLVVFEAQIEEGLALYRPAEVWIKINKDFSGDTDALMARTASLFKEVTGSSDRVVVTLWEGSVRVKSLEF